MNKIELIREYRGILTLVKTLVNAYSKKEVTIHVRTEDGDVKKEADRMEQHLNFLSEYGEITTIFRDYNNQKFTVGISMGMLVFYQNYFDDIEYILSNTELDNEHTYQLGCMIRLRKLFKVAKDNHCSNCCDDEDVD